MIGRRLIGPVLSLVLLALLAAPAASAPPPRPGAVILDARSDRVVARVPIDEAITAAIPDGRGGW